jgi:hypothetical protein
MKNNECRVVAHFLGGRLVKGYTYDFNQDKDRFHVFPREEQVDGVEILLHELKAVFFVKTLEGNRNYCCPDICENDLKCLSGMKLKVCFSDGECIYATTRGYSPARKGFFILPLDPHDNNSCIYVVKSATTSVDIIR